MIRDSLRARTRRRCAFVLRLALILTVCTSVGCNGGDSTSSALSVGGVSAAAKTGTATKAGTPTSSKPPPTAAPPTHGQANVVVPAASSAQFNQTNATWSLAAGSAGTITPDGLYTAPEHVDPVHVMNGVQILPADHIYYAKITNLPVIPYESTIMRQIKENPGHYVGSGMSLIPAFHNNVLDDTMPMISLRFLYTGPKAAINFNGQYRFMSGNDPESPYIGVPGEFIQNGIYQSYMLEGDRHIFGTSKDDGITYEVYNPHPMGSDTRNAMTNAVSGSFYGLSAANPYSIGPATVAGGELLSAGLITADEIRTHNIRHVSFFTMPNGAIAGGTNCGKPPAIVECFIWPATARAYAGADYIPYGARFRLKASVDTVNNPATGQPYSPEAQAVFQAWKDYGVMLSDGGGTGANEVDVDVLEDYGLGVALTTEVSNSKAADGLRVGDWNHWDIVDESSLERPGAALSGQVNQANSYVHPVYATAIATDNTSHKQTAYPIILQGVTVGVPNSVETIQSGMQVQMESWVRGSLNPNVHWSMSPALGTLTASGLYTAPVVAAPTSTLLTVTSDADSQASTTVRVTVFPAGGLYMMLGGLGKSYTDTKGHVWQPEFFGRIGFTQPSTFPGPNNQFNNAGEWISNPPDLTIWEGRRFNFGGDFYYRMHVPNGTYTITLYHGVGAGPNGATLAPHVYEFAIESMGKVVNRDYDLSVEAGGRRGVPLTYTMTTTVTDGVLTFAERQVYVGNVPTGTVPQVSLNAFSVVAE